MLEYTRKSKIKEVINDPVFEDYGRLLFPVEHYYYSGNTLEQLDLTWYSEINPDKTVEIINYLKKQRLQNKPIFFPIYTQEEIKKDPNKKDTGLFYFQGLPDHKTAIINAGGAFAYVGAMHDSFPHALELSKKGYNAFALIYRSGARNACEDLSKAIAFIHQNADALQLDVHNYSLWGGSAGARMAAWLGSYGTNTFIHEDYPLPGAVIMQYTGLSDIFGNEPPTYNCVGTNDYIASYTTMQQRIHRIKQNGTPAKIEIFRGLSHGFGLGQGTIAEGWIDHAIKFWEENS